MVLAKFLQGTAYITYYPGPGPRPATGACKDSSDSRNEHVESCHHHQQEDLPSPQHFLAVFTPDQTIRIEEPSSASGSGWAPRLPSQGHGNEKFNDDPSACYYVLTGTPHSWGTYPPDMPPPHGCIPPHLYYHVVITQHHYPHPHDHLEHDPAQSLSSWTIPFVHRFGDGEDDAGGLTSSYQALEHLEDADDEGRFLDQRLDQIQQEKTITTSPVVVSVSSCTPTTSSLTVLLSLYACTQVLISERRTIDILKQHIFLQDVHSNSSSLPEALKALQSHLWSVSPSSPSSTSQPLPFHIIQSDLKLILADP